MVCFILCLADNLLKQFFCFIETIYWNSKPSSRQPQFFDTSAEKFTTHFPSYLTIYTKQYCGMCFLCIYNTTLKFLAIHSIFWTSIYTLLTFEMKRLLDNTYRPCGCTARCINTHFTLNILQFRVQIYSQAQGVLSWCISRSRMVKLVWLVDPSYDHPAE